MAQLREEEMGSAPIGKLMVQMAIPSIVAQFINLLYNIVDRIYIGHIPGIGVNALTGVGLTLPVITLISAFSALVSNGGAPLASIWLGKGDRKRAQEILGSGTFFLLVCSVLLMIVFYLFQRPFLMAFGASEATIEYAVDYLSVYLVGTIFVELALGLNAFIICQGHSNIAMFSIVIGAAANIVLDPIFIFIFGMGVKGAGWATVISQCLSAAWNVGYLASKRSSLRLERKYIRPNFPVMKRYCALGVSPFIMRSTESLISIVMNHGLMVYGGDLYVGSLTIMQSVMQLFNAPVAGFTQGVQPIISYNFGAGKFDRVRKTYRRMIGFSFGSQFVCTLACMIFPRVFAGMFTTDAEMIALVGQKMPIFFFGMLFMGLQSGVQPTFMALGQAKMSMFVALLRKVLLLVPLALILPHFWGVMGIYLAEPISDTLSASTAGTVFLLRIKKILTRETLDKIK